MTTAVGKKSGSLLEARKYVSRWNADPPWGVTDNTDQPLAVTTEPKEWGLDTSDIYDLLARDLWSMFDHKAKDIDNQSHSPISDQPRTLATCIHHWIIDPASGPTSKGVCKRCGERRVFRNFWDDETLREGAKSLLDYNRWDTPYERDRDEEFVKELTTSGAPQ